jgi:hypothetical protein
MNIVVILAILILFIIIKRFLQPKNNFKKNNDKEDKEDKKDNIKSNINESDDNKIIIKNEDFYDIEEITNEQECEFGFKRKELIENTEDLFVN